MKEAFEVMGQHPVVTLWLGIVVICVAYALSEIGSKKK